MQSENAWIVQTAKNMWTRKLKSSEVIKTMDNNERLTVLTNWTARVHKQGSPGCEGLV